jgi:hypothetical protein
MKKIKVEGTEPKYPKVIETFREFGSWEIHQLQDNTFSCFNGNVRINKFRVTIEKVEEPIEVITARLQKLWEDCDNHHHWEPLKNAAKKYNYELDPAKMGINSPKRR